MDGRAHFGVSFLGLLKESRGTDLKNLSSIITGIRGFRWPVFIVFALVLALCIPGLFRLDVTVEMEDYFLDSDPVRSAGQEFSSIFGGGEFLGVLVEAPNVYSPDCLSLIRRIGTALENSVPGTFEAVSLANLDGKLTGGATLEFRDGTLVSDTGTLEKFRSAVTDSPLLNGSLVSGDSKEAWILVSLDPVVSGKNEVRVGEAAWDVLQEFQDSEYRITPSGVPLVAYRKYVELMEDLLRVIVFAAVVAIILSLILLRSLKGVLGTLAVFVGSVVCVLGIQGWMGLTLDSGFLGVPILLTMGISIGYTVHVYRYYRLEMSTGAAPHQAASMALARTFRPVFFTAVTTMVSLMSFLFVDVKPIRWVGYTSALSVLAAFLLSVFLFPSVLSLGSSAGRLERSRGEEPGNPERLFGWIARMSVSRGGWLIVAFALVTGLSVFGLSRLVVDFNTEKMMGTRLPHMRDQIHVGESEIAVGEYMNLMITMPEGYFHEASSIRQVQELENRLASFSGVRRVRSVVGVLEEVNSLMHRRNPEYTELPESDVSLKALVRLIGSILPDESDSWVDESGARTRLYIEISDFSSRKIENVIEEAHRLVDEIFPESAETGVSGSTYQVAMMNQYITRGLLRSVGTALAVISLIMILVFRSLRWGLVAMIPNVFPVLVAGAVLGFAGIPLEFVTMTVAPIILGLAVDDTIHFMGALKEGLNRGRDFPTVLQESLVSVGTAISQTTLILCVAFLIFAFSRVNSIRYMGIVAATGMLAAYLADLLLVPVLTRMLSAGEDRSPGTSDE